MLVLSETHILYIVHVVMYMRCMQKLMISHQQRRLDAYFTTILISVKWQGLFIFIELQFDFVVLCGICDILTKLWPNKK